jgi:hypothetical protein
MKNRVALIVAGFWGWAVAAPALGDPTSAWLGAQIGPVPRVLDVHFGLNGHGAMILNVAKDSPADKAGLEQFDVIVKLNHQDIAGVEQFINRVRNSEPGTKVTLQVLHRAKESQIEVVLVAPPVGGPEYKYPPLPDAMLSDRFDVRGKIFRKGPGGWRMEDLGEFKDVPRLFEHVMPGFPHNERFYWFDEGRKPVMKFRARVNREGKTIEVYSGENGSIVVHRMPPDETKTYPTPADLQKADPEAYKVYQDAIRTEPKVGESPGVVPPPRQGEARRDQGVEQYREWIKGLADKLPNIDRQRLNDLLEEMKKDWGPGLDHAKQQLGELEKRIEERIEQLRQSRWPTSGPSEPAIRFESGADGKITAHLRQGDSELTLHFENADQLKARRPGLYQKYEALEKAR